MTGSRLRPARAPLFSGEANRSATSEIMFSRAGRGTSPKLSGPWVAPHGIGIYSVALGAAETSTVDVEIRVDGVAQATFSLAGTSSVQGANIAVATGSSVQIYVTGTSVDLTVSLRYARR